ncbi:MAG: hypothetical protein ACI9YH_001005 [Colwellia sp.]|jgi:hypothetical protein
MKRISLNFLLSAILLLASNALFANDDVSAITSVIQKYFDGTSKGQPELVKQAFSNSLELQYVGKKGELKRWQGTDYIANIKSGRIKKRTGKIISIDITGNAAVVKATVTTDKTLFTDYLLLLKLDSGWKVTNKIFTAEKR